MGALSDIVRQGKALYVGISNYQADEASRAIAILKANGTPCLIHQPRYNMFERWVEDGLLGVLDRGGVGHEKLMEARNQLLGNAAANPAIAYARPNGLDDTAQYAISIDNRLAASLGLSLSDISTDLSVLAGGAYVNDFIDRGRVKKVYVQADAPFRMVEADLRHWNFRNNLGDLVPFSSIASTDWTMGPARLERYNGVASLEIQGEPVPGVSSGTAMAAMEAEVAKLGKDFGVLCLLSKRLRQD